MTVRTPVQRITAVVAGAFLGLAGAFSFVAPASAYSGELTGSSSCTDRGWKVTWKLTTIDTNGTDGVISDVEASITEFIPPPGFPSTPKPPALSTFVDNGTVTGDGVVTEDQAFGPDDKTVELGFTVTWHDGEKIHTQDVRASAHAPAGCTYPVPTGTATPPGDWLDPDAPAETTAPTATASGTPAPAVNGDAEGAGGGAGGGLPVTGAAAATIAGVAAVLFAVGAALLVASRRRKMTFIP